MCTKQYLEWETFLCTSGLLDPGFDSLSKEEKGPVAMHFSGMVLDIEILSGLRSSDRIRLDEVVRETVDFGAPVAEDRMVSVIIPGKRRCNVRSLNSPKRCIDTTLFIDQSVTTGRPGLFARFGLLGNIRRKVALLSSS